MADRLLSENKLGKRFFAGIIFANLLAQMGWWGYKYWSGQEYSRQQRIERHWEEVYSAVMDNSTCSVLPNSPSEFPGKLYVLACYGHSKLTLAERLAVLHKMNLGFKQIERPKKLRGIREVFFDENKLADLLSSNSPGTNTSIYHFIDAK